jgi:cyclophilin family peptidyl-prolyl cis-trans isomerase
MRSRSIFASFALAFLSSGISTACSHSAVSDAALAASAATPASDVTRVSAEIPAVAGTATSTGVATADNWKAKVTAPDVWVIGGRCMVKLALTAPAEGSSVPAWQVTAAGFQVDGAPLAPHAEQPAIALAPGETREFEVEIGLALKATTDFDLAFGTAAPVKVRVLEPAPAGLKFIDEAATPLSELEKYWVVLDTVRGTLVCEFYPAIAQNHVRNFLDLAYSGFYNGTTFHRVAPGFMIQGGDPTGTGGGDGPRSLKAEFTRYKKHLPGTLSMARAQSPDSASCQFFIMHGAAPFLDGQYSIFGNLVRGYSTLEKIVRSKGSAGPDGTIRPNELQAIVRATVVKRPSNADDWREGPDGKALSKPEAAAPQVPAK